MLKAQTQEELRKRILTLVSEYVRTNEPEDFVPRKNWIHYAGRVFDENEFVNLVDAALDGWVTAGRFTEEFESSLASYLGAYSSLTVNSGSSANLVTVSSLTSPLLGDRRLKKGDEVITVSAGFPTTVNPIIQNGLIPVFLDIEPGTYNIKADLIDDAISDRTKAIVIAHALGNPFDLETVTKIARKHNLFLALSDNSTVCYIVSEVYNKNSDSGIRWDSIAYDWKVDSPLLSERDRNFPSFAEFKSPFNYTNSIQEV